MSTTNIPVFNDTSGTIQRQEWLDEGQPPFPQTYDPAAVANAIRSFWDEVVLAS